SMRPRRKGSVTAPRLTSRNGMAQRARRPHLDMLLYLGGEADLVRIFHPGEKATQGQDRAHRPRMLARSRRADVQSGKALTPAIEQWKFKIAAMTALPPAAPYGPTCAAPIHIFTGPA